MERFAGRLFGKCILELGGFFFSFLAEQSPIPAAWERAGAEPGPQLTAEPCSAQPYFDKAFGGGVGVAFIPLS